MDMIRLPPGVPSKATPRSLSRNVGDMLDRGRLPGAIALASPPIKP